MIVDLARYFGGAEVRVLNLAKALGPESCQIACLKASPLAERARAAGFRPLELTDGKANPRTAFVLARMVREGDFNIVDAHNVQSHLWGYLSALLGKRPALVATVHSSTRMEQRSQLKGIFYEMLERWTVPKSDHVVTVSGYLRSELIGWNISTNRISVVPNGVQVNRTAEGEREAVRRELGLSPTDRVIGTVGRLEPAKGLFYLLQAIEKLLPAWPQIKCVMVGDGRLAVQLREFVASHGLQGHVLFTGFRSDVPRLLEAFDVFALPSLTEGIPIALLEACACARPIVASRVGGVPEVISDGRTGYLVDAGDVSGLADAIDVLLRDEALARWVGGQAAVDVANRYSIKNMLNGTWQAYESALARRGAS
ncbi:MAG: glycosyltransferase family 4 protein [Anaerolineae bacterium]